MNPDIEEKLTIHEMISQYAYAYDSNDAEGFAQVFAEDGVLEIFIPGETIPAIRLQSRKEIHEWAAQRLRERRGRFTSRHFQSGVRFEALTAEEARLRVMVLVTRQEATGSAPYMHLTGIYHDVWRKSSDGWRLAHRSAYTDRDPSSGGK
jgi:ketosteroid isomerase-like protein